MKRRSFRRSLILGNAAVVIALLVAFAFVLTAASQLWLKSKIDEDLRRDAEAMGREGPRPGPGGRGGQGGAGGGPGAPGGEGGRGGDGFDGGPPPPRDLYAEAQRAADVRRPRFFDFFRPGMPDDSETPLDADGLAAARHGQESLRNIDFDGHAIRVISVPIFRGGQIAGEVQIARDTSDLRLLAQIQATTLLIFLPLAGFASVLVAIGLANRALRPISAMSRAAAAIGGSEMRSADLAKRLPETGDDEMAQLAHTFNEMLGRLQAAFLQQRRFTDDASHELRTPLTRLRVATSGALTHQATEDELREALAVADRAGLSMSRLVEGLLTLARSDAGQLNLRNEALDLRVAVSEALDALPFAARIEAQFPSDRVSVLGDPHAIGQITTNLLENAVRHTPPDGRIGLKIEAAADRATLQIWDTGEGISPSHLPHLFERFYRADASRNRADGGAGLGLAICHDLAQAMGAEIEVRSELGRGTVFNIFFPISQSK